MEGLVQAAACRSAHAVEELLHGTVIARRAQECRADGGALGSGPCAAHASVAASLGGRRAVGRPGDAGASAAAGAPSHAEARSGSSVDHRRHGFSEAGKHAVGVARQYCGELGQSANCQAAVSWSVSTWNSSLPIAWRLYLPEVWCQDAAPLPAGRGPGRSGPFQPSQRLRWGRFGKRSSGGFRGSGMRRCGLRKGHAISHGSDSTGTAICGGHGVERHRLGTGKTTLAGTRAPTRSRCTPAQRLRRQADHKPISVKQLALGLPSSAWKEIGWRQGREGIFRSRFAAVRVRPAHRGYRRTKPYPEEWLLIEWPKKASDPPNTGSPRCRRRPR